MFGNVLRRIAAWPLTAQVWLVVPALIVLGLAILFSPFVAAAALIVLIVAVAALISRIARRRPLRNWGLIAIASLLLLVTFGGISSALYGGGTLQRASSPSEPKEEKAEEQETPDEEVEKEASTEDVAPAEEEAAEVSFLIFSSRLTSDNPLEAHLSELPRVLLLGNLEGMKRYGGS